MRRAEREAEQVLTRGRLEFQAIEEPWDNYAVDVDLVGAILFDLGVSRVPDLRVGNREYAGFLDGDARLIAVEANHHEHRQRFSVAHEIGHFVLHYQPQPSAGGLFACTTGDMEVSAPSPGEPARSLHLKQEAEANAFAGALLMSESSVRAMHKVTGGRLMQLARHFRVSPRAMAIRLGHLRLSHI